MNDIINAIPIGVGLAFMIGPVFFVLLETSATKGFRAALVFDIGVIIADVIFLYFSYFGSRTLLEKIKDDPRLFLLGGGILFVYGLLIFFKRRKPIITDDDLVVVEKNNYFGLLLKGFLLNFINIGVLAFWLGMIVVVSPQLEMNDARIFTYFAAVLGSYFITDLLKILLAKQLKNKLTPLVIRKIKRGMGVALMIFGLFLAVQGLFSDKTMQKIDSVIEGKVDESDSR
ncbi:LysE family translocator [Aureibaculum marinum]|uniref:LysE family translocator n=1 Tax=Aureibaculum marinum TaxID=2487930 RepID=A0A3N4NS15_9FLAO|nr:LysE family transporter [Aureibaculum marinum]RPD95876.1 LysE family translocator [Aureibaculum marinum]